MQTGSAFALDTYKLLLALIGLALLGAAWLPHLLKRHPLTFPIAYVGAGAAMYLLPWSLPAADPVRYGVVIEHLAEMAVLVALVGAGLRIDTPFGWKRWRLTWRLLAITMPLTIAGGMLLGHYLLGYGLATALLLGAVLAPTDPVLASDVQVAPPGEGEEDPVRFALTSEAGLNDGLAFPFVWLAIALAVASGTGDAMDWGLWMALDVGWRVLGGAAIGGVVGYGLMHVIFRTERDTSLSSGSDGLTALAITLLVYGVTELCHAYGFVAVFVAALVIRHHERAHRYHTTLNLFAEQCERLLTALLLILFGGALVTGLLSQPGWEDWLFAALFVLVARPAAGWLGMIGSGIDRGDRLAIALFGIRGIGSFYYLAFAINHAMFEDPEALWSQVGLVVLLSILLHGLTAQPGMRWLDRRREGRQPR